MYNKRVSTCLWCEVLSPVRLSFLRRTAQGNFYIFDCQRTTVNATGLFFFVGKPVDNDFGTAHVAPFALRFYLLENLIAEVNGKALHVGPVPLFIRPLSGVG